MMPTIYRTIRVYSSWAPVLSWGSLCYFPVFLIFVNNVYPCLHSFYRVFFLFLLLNGSCWTVKSLHPLRSTKLKTTKHSVTIEYERHINYCWICKQTCIPKSNIARLLCLSSLRSYTQGTISLSQNRRISWRPNSIIE